MYGSVLIVDGNGSRSDHSLRQDELPTFLLRLRPVDNTAFSVTEWLADSGWLNHLWKESSYHKKHSPGSVEPGLCFPMATFRTVPLAGSKSKVQFKQSGGNLSYRLLPGRCILCLRSPDKLRHTCSSVPASGNSSPPAVDPGGSGPAAGSLGAAKVSVDVLVNAPGGLNSHLGNVELDNLPDILLRRSKIGQLIPLHRHGTDLPFRHPAPLTSCWRNKVVEIKIL